MFNALNRLISRLDSDVSTPKSDYGGFGFQVLRNKTPDLAIEPWFDFIVGINGRMIDNPDPSLFAHEVRNCAGHIVTLEIWSAKGQKIRTIHIPVSEKSRQLGLTLQWTSLNIVSNIWHILDVPVNSPADKAGLLPYSDYIIGAPDGNLHGEIGLGELVESHIGQSLVLYVYNNEFDVTREVTVNPVRDWGGEGALGCVLGFGALHRLPAPLSEPIAGPGETLFETESLQNPGENIEFASSHYMSNNHPGGQENRDLLVPAQLATLDSNVVQLKKREKRYGNGPNTAFINDLLLEGEKRSREIDHAPRPSNSLPPPPPKAAGSTRTENDHASD
ncbi:Uncharacterized protein C1D4.02c [Golovinomyces cichoracearum]|uniref:Uncharacterized protein C1D4.02c n=1 Tax=Golovinomyces cichoracearum TaxID=62708 RepID=A0A420IHX4_9PEZI|nr:Uncharacterized protein C1D4.02c [Golovinomyces cichoracearum]